MRVHRFQLTNYVLDNREISCLDSEIHFFPAYDEKAYSTLSTDSMEVRFTSKNPGDLNVSPVFKATRSNRHLH